MTVFNTGPNAVTMDFNPGYIGYVKRNLGHYMENVGDTDMVVLEVFRSTHFGVVSLSDWLARTPPALVAQHLNIDVATIAKFPNDKTEIMPQRSGFRRCSMPELDNTRTACCRRATNTP